MTAGELYMMLSGMDPDTDISVYPPEFQAAYVKGRLREACKPLLGTPSEEAVPKVEAAIKAALEDLKLKPVHVDLGRCTTTCSNGSRCILPMNHHPADRHETEDCPCVVDDPPKARLR